MRYSFVISLWFLARGRGGEYYEVRMHMVGTGIGGQMGGDVADERSWKVR